MTRDQLKKHLSDKGFLNGYASDDSARAGMSKYINELAGKNVVSATKELVRPKPSETIASVSPNSTTETPKPLPIGWFR